MEENNKFWSLNGVLSRRGFIINFLLVMIVGLITFVSPLALLFFLRPELITSFSAVTVNISQLPFLLVIWAILASVLRLALIFPSIVRRMRDIIGKDDEKIIPLTFLLCTVVFFGAFLPLIKYTYYAFILFLIFAQGQITSKKPKSDVIKFNWGAFWGTWIWGLFNKSYKTLWIILLWPLTGILPFMLLFGLKGNEWAYKNKKYESIEKFHLNQSNQSLIFGFAFPFIFFVSVIFMLRMISIGVKHFAPINFDKKLGAYYVKIKNINTENMFENINLDNDEYIFSINPQIWTKFTQSQKEYIIKEAGFYAASNIDSNFNSLENTNLSSEILNKVKIISTFNQEPLAKCDIKDKENFPQGCDFNSYPSLP